MTKEQNRIMRNPEFQKEYETLKRKHSIPTGKNLEEMLATEDGKKRYEERNKKWEAFKKKWNILFMIGSKPVLKQEKRKTKPKLS